MSRTAICDTAREAVAGIADGATILVGGFGMAGMPTTLIDALIEQGATDLTIVSNNAGNGDTGLAALLAAGRVDQGHLLVSAAVGFVRVRRAVPGGQGRNSRWCHRETWPNGSGRPARASAPSSARPASARRWPRVRRPARSTAATTCWSTRSSGDVALIGAHIGDRAGNLLYRKTARNFGPVMATAATLTIAEVVPRRRGG